MSERPNPADDCVWAKPRQLFGAVGGLVQARHVVGAGLLFLAVLIVLAVLPDRVSRLDAVRDPELVRLAALGAQAQDMPQGGLQAMPVVMPGLTPFVPTPPLAYTGRVTQVVSVGAEMGWGQVHIWINDGTGVLREISLAPISYLQQLGCANLNGQRVSGQAFQFDPTRPDAELYAKTVTVNGNLCRLRDDEGLALWMTTTP